MNGKVISLAGRKRAAERQRAESAAAKSAAAAHVAAEVCSAVEQLRCLCELEPGDSARRRQLIASLLSLMEVARTLERVADADRQSGQRS